MTDDAHAMPEGQEPPPAGHRAMAIVRWILVLAMAFVAVASVAYGFGWFKPTATQSADIWYCPMHPSVVQDHPGECPICGMALVRREGADAGATGETGAASHQGHRHNPSDPYACPMHPEETGLSPADRCPICSMRLEPRSTVDAGIADVPDASDAAVPGLAAIDLSLDRVQLIGMKTARATKEALVPDLRTVGVVSAPEGGLAKVTTRFGGWIESLIVSETGRPVRRGELLAIVYSPQVYLAEREYLTAKSFGGSGGAGDLTADARQRLELLGISSSEIDAIDKGGKARKTFGIAAPASGFIVQKSAVKGVSFQPGTELFTIADLSKVWVIADVYESELARVKVGQSASLSLATFPDRAFAGEVKFIYPNVDAATRTAKVRLEFKNAAMDLKPGMYGTVSLSLPASFGVVIPREALVDTGLVQYVFVDKGGGRFEPRRVTLGVRAGEKVEIQSGVAEGETVVTTGNFLLDSESRLRAAIEGAAAAPGAK